MSAPRPLAGLSLALAMLVLLGAASPQNGRIIGHVSILERPGVKTKDIATSIVYLQPLDAHVGDDRGAAPSEATIAMRGREFVPHVSVIRSGGSVA